MIYKSTSLWLSYSPLDTPEYTHVFQKTSKKKSNCRITAIYLEKLCDNSSLSLNRWKINIPMWHVKIWLSLMQKIGISWFLCKKFKLFDWKLIREIKQQLIFSYNILKLLYL